MCRRNQMRKYKQRYRGISKLMINNIIVTLQMAEIDDLELYGLAAAAAVAVTIASVFRNRLAF